MSRDYAVGNDVNEAELNAELEGLEAELEGLPDAVPDAASYAEPPAAAAGGAPAQRWLEPLPAVPMGAAAGAAAPARAAAATTR